MGLATYAPYSVVSQSAASQDALPEDIPSTEILCALSLAEGKCDSAFDNCGL